MKKLALVTMAGALGLAAIGCSTTANTNANIKTNMANANSTAVVVNSNQAPITGTNANTTATTGNSNRYSTTMTRADYEKNEAEYKTDQAASTIGQGADDKWIWFKTRAALLATSDLRESTINVDVNNSVVTLKGSVASKEQSDKAASVAKGIEGVKSVTNSLTVKPNDSLTNHMVGTGNSASDGGTKGNANTTHK